MKNYYAKFTRIITITGLVALISGCSELGNLCRKAPRDFMTDVIGINPGSRKIKKYAEQMKETNYGEYRETYQEEK